MERVGISDQKLEEVVGGSIVFTPDCTTCGLNNNKQFKVNDFNAIIKYIQDNKDTMTEKEMLKAMKALGYITKIV